MRPTWTNPKKIAALEKHIHELEMKLQGRESNQPEAGRGAMERASNQPDAGGGAMARASALSPRSPGESPRFVNGSGRQERINRPPVLSIPDDTGNPREAPPSNEREARLRRRLIERLSKQKKSTTARASDAFVPSSRPTSTIHKQSNSPKMKLFVDRAAAAHSQVHAWGEHGLGLPGLAKDHDNRENARIAREEQRKIIERRAKENEEKARKVREEKIHARRRREREAEAREKEAFVKVNNFFKPPPISTYDASSSSDGDSTVSEDSIGDGDAGQKDVTKDQGRELNMPFATTDGLRNDKKEEGNGERIAQRTKADFATKQKIEDQLPPKRRIYASNTRRPASVHAKSVPKKSGNHDLFKIYNESSGAIRGNVNRGSWRDHEKPAPASTRKSYNFINNAWG